MICVCVREVNRDGAAIQVHNIEILHRLKMHLSAGGKSHEG